MSMLDDPLLDLSLSPAFPQAYDLWVGRGPEIEALAVAWFTVSRGHAPGDSDLRHGLWRVLNEPERWGTLRVAFQSAWPVAGQEHAVPPAPPAPRPTAPPIPSTSSQEELPTGPASADPRATDLAAFVKRVGEASPHWASAAAGDGVAAHRVTRQIAAALAAIDPRWGLITKQPGQQQCTWHQCGPGDGTGYGEDVVAFRPGDDQAQWIGYDCIGGAGAPGARVQWVGPIPIRPGNQWAPLPVPLDRG
jgi:hypothetical protein